MSTTPSDKDRLQANDVLFNTRNTLDLVGKVSIWRCELPVAYFNSNIMRMAFDPVHIASDQFMNFVLNTPRTVSAFKAIATGTTSVAAIYGRDLGAVQIPIPGKVEQSLIAAALHDADALIESLEQLLAKKRDLKQGSMQELLTGKSRLPGFGEAWKPHRLDSLGHWTGGMTPSMSTIAYWEQGTIPWISSGDVKVSRLASTAFSITEHAVKQKATTLIPAQSIVIVARSGILRKHLPVAMTTKPMAINQDIKAISPLGSVSSEYLLHTLTYHGDDILGRCLKSGTTVESIEFSWFKSFTIPLPNKQEQSAIAAVLSDMDDEITNLESKLTKARQLKQGMMQELLTGRIRLI